MDKKTRSRLIWAGVLIAIIGIIVLITWSITKPGNYEEFAQCLTQEEVVMYGTDWCHFCQEQKGKFGNSFKNINYVNCDFEEEKCLANGVEGYPTWKIKNETYPGVKSLKTLSALSGCELNPSSEEDKN